jgi:hypothetical protein
MDWEIKTKDIKFLLAFVEELDSLSVTRGLRNLREGCTRGKLQASTLISAGLFTCKQAIKK